MQNLQKAFVAALFMFVACAAPARATDDDFQAWQQIIANTKLSQGVTGTLEVQPRFTDDASRLGQLLIRPSIGFQIVDKTILSLGYAYVRTSPENGAVTDENRLWQQLMFPIASRDGLFTVTGRTRLEQRFRNDGDEMGWRLRQQVRLAIPLAKSGWQGIAWSEGFFNLNDTDWGARSGIDRWRNFAGLGIPLREGVVLEPGYLNQYVNRTGGDQVDHVLSLTLNVNF
jgi:hypothetical protein